jgi:acetolactate synthase regulatory subunit
MYDFSLQLLCTSKPGTLSRIVREIHQVGLQYQAHQIETNGDQSRISISAAGLLNCSLESLEELFGNFPEVLEVQQMRVTSGGREVTGFKTTVSETQLPASEHLTPAVILAAEKRLSDILGPVASVIVESVAPDCVDAGGLYARLAAELDDADEREYFLSIIATN